MAEERKTAPLRPPVEHAPEKPLTTEDQLKIVAWFKDKGRGDQPCPVCGNTEWGIEPDLVTAPLLRGRRLILDQGYPLILMFCTRCAHALFFSARVIGVFPPTEPAPAEVPHGAS